MFPFRGKTYGTHVTCMICCAFVCPVYDLFNPSGGENIEKIVRFVIFLFFFEKMENGTKMITSCSIRRVGRRLLTKSDQKQNHWKCIKNE